MPSRHRVVIIGGGFGGLRAARALKSAPVDVTLIDPSLTCHQASTPRRRNGMITRRSLLATAAALTLAGGSVEATEAQDTDTSRIDLPRVEILTDNEVRTYLLVFRSGQEVMKGLVGFAKEHGVVGGQLTGIGALSNAMLAYFDPETNAYVSHREDGQLELLSLIGNAARYADAPFFHVHVTIGRRDGQARGGHLLQATVRPTVELLVTTYAKPMRRQIDAEWGMPLLAPSSARTGQR